MDRIVSTYSNGTIAIHDVLYTYTTNDNDNNNNRCNNVQLIEYERWTGHTLPAMMSSTIHPAEVWTACFVRPTNASEQQQNNNEPSIVVATGGDEGYCKLWDIRAVQRPIQKIETEMGAGVTCLSPHPTYPSIMAMGSCTYFW